MPVSRWWLRVAVGVNVLGAAVLIFAFYDGPTRSPTTVVIAGFLLTTAVVLLVRQRRDSVGVQQVRRDGDA